MRWTTLISILFCAATFVTAFAVLAIVSYNMSMTSTKEDRFPLPVMNDWRNYLIQLIPVSVYIITETVVSCWAITRRRKPYSAVMVLLMNCAGLALCIVYCIMIYSLQTKTGISPEDIKARTIQIFQDRATEQGDNKWIPTWLAEVQSQSSTCCGIISFEDWREFWPKYENEVPKSCCHDQDKCITDVDEIEWPEIPSKYIKNDDGCANLIIEKAGSRIFEALKFLLILTILLLLSLAAFSFQYATEFCTSNSADNPKRNIANLTVGETWARMGFGKSNGNSKGVTIDLGSPGSFTGGTEPSSYTDIYLKQLDGSLPSLAQSITPNFTDSNNSNIFIPFTLQSTAGTRKVGSLSEVPTNRSQLQQGMPPVPTNFTRGKPPKRTTNFSENNIAPQPQQ